VVIPSTVLIVWWLSAQPDVAVFRRLVPAHVPVALPFLGTAVVAVLNAAVEELISRGVILSSGMCAPSIARAFADFTSWSKETR
jgi:membrane protease YdiL (CAAX protease family)